MATKKEENKITTDSKDKKTTAVDNKRVALTNKNSGQSVYANKRQDKSKARKRNFRKKEARDEFDQRMIDIARVTRVMAGGKRMRFRATIAIGDKKGKIGLGMAKGADVSLAVNKAVNNAKKVMIEVPIVNDTIPHEIFHKFGAAKIILKPARQGKGVIAGGALRTLLELAGIKNITSKNLGTNNKVTISKCLIEALDLLKKVESKKPRISKNLKVVKNNIKKSIKAEKKTSVESIQKIAVDK